MSRNFPHNSLTEFITLFVKVVKNHLGIILEQTCLDSLVQLVGSPIKGWRLRRRERVGRQRRVSEWDDGSRVAEGGLSMVINTFLINSNKKLVLPSRRESRSVGEAKAAWCSAARMAPGAGLVKDREGTHVEAV